MIVQVIHSVELLCMTSLFCDYVDTKEEEYRVVWYASFGLVTRY